MQLPPNGTWGRYLHPQPIAVEAVEAEGRDMPGHRASQSVRGLGDEIWGPQPTVPAHYILHTYIFSEVEQK